MQNNTPVNPIDPRFDSVVYFVHANSYETLTLWQHYARENKFYGFDKVDFPKINWVQDGRGFSMTIGHIDKDKPVHVAFFFQTLDGYNICTWEATSRYVDFDLIDEWFDEFLPDVGRTNCMNFGHALGKIRELKNESK